MAEKQPKLGEDWRDGSSGAVGCIEKIEGGYVVVRLKDGGALTTIQRDTFREIWQPADHTFAMARFRGTIRYSDLEGGHFQLRADDGKTYELEGSDPILRRDGARVEIDGSLDRAAMSLAMTGPRLKVKSVKLA